VLDFTVALEALFVPYDENAHYRKLGRRFREHGACFLARDSSQRAVMEERLRRIYEVRSRLVHGGGYPGPEEISKARDEARELAQRGLLRAVREGFPTAEAFNQMLSGLG
jgi:hypothetical protein